MERMYPTTQTTTVDFLAIVDLIVSGSADVRQVFASETCAAYEHSASKGLLVVRVMELETEPARRSSETIDLTSEEAARKFLGSIRDMKLISMGHVDQRLPSAADIPLLAGWCGWVRADKIAWLHWV